MLEITLENYRCFHARQPARLAPLTLLVGENSTGKTSFLALIRALWDCVCRRRIPNFKDPPFDLGSFDEIAHHRGSRGGRANGFEAELKFGHGYQASVTFEKYGTIPIPVKTRLAHEKTWIEDALDVDQSHVLSRVGTSRGSWELQVPEEVRNRLFHTDEPDQFGPYPLFLRGLGGGYDHIKPLSSSPPFNDKDERMILDLTFSIRRPSGERPFANAPVRSKPRRTYDPARSAPDPEGDYIPMYLASVFSQDAESWKKLKHQLERFGSGAGLFDEVTIKQLGKKMSGPFQVQVRKFGSKRKGPRRNLIDVGNGVSQVLPVIIDLLRPGAHRTFLLQQPEVHLHPSAQAALGSLFCQIAGQNRQLIIETHSDNLMDRIRMDVRDGKTNLKPDDVSILFFERRDLDVRIHSLRLDEEGNVYNAPDVYRRFFMEETQRSLGL